MAHILVIDDEKNIRNLVRRALERCGHEVATADSGAMGLARYDDGAHWNLVLIDQRMPGPEGRLVVREILRRRPQARVVMMSAFASVCLASEVIGAGVRDSCASRSPWRRCARRWTMRSPARRLATSRPMKLDLPESATASTFSTAAEPPVDGAASKPVERTVMTLTGSDDCTVAMAAPA